MRAAIGGSIYSGAGIVRGLVVVQIPTPAMQVRVPAGMCAVSDGQNGFLPMELAASTDLDVTASSPTLPRIDSVIAEFVDNGASSLYRIRVVAGTANASPTQPSLPYADQPTGKTLRLYNIAVAAAATSIVGANITPQAGAASIASYGRLLVVASDGGRPTIPAVSEAIWRTDKLCREVWTGSAWVEDYVSTVGPAWKTFSSTWTGSVSNPTIGNGSLSGRYIKVGRTVTFTLTLTWGSTTGAGSGAYGFTLPVAPGYESAAAAVLVDTSASARYSASAWITPASGIFRVLPPTDAGSAGLGGTSLFTFATGDQIFIAGSYEAAS